MVCCKTGLYPSCTLASGLKYVLTWLQLHLQVLWVCYSHQLYSRGLGKAQRGSASVLCGLQPPVHHWRWWGVLLLPQSQNAMCDAQYPQPCNALQSMLGKACSAKHALQNMCPVSHSASVCMLVCMVCADVYARHAMWRDRVGIMTVWGNQQCDVYMLCHIGFCWCWWSVQPVTPASIVC